MTMQKTVNEIIKDKMIGHQVGLLRLSTGITNKLVTLLNMVEKDLVDQLKKLDSERINVLLTSIRQIIAAANLEKYSLLEKELKALAIYEANYVERVINGTLPVKFDMIIPSTTMLSGIVTSKPFQGKLLKEWVEDFSEDQRRRLRDAVRIGMVEGESLDQIVRRVRGTKAQRYKDGILEIDRRNAQALVRTAVNHTANQSRELLYSENDDLVDKVQWVATLDNRTCPLCQPLDGKIFQIHQGVRPALHIQCRCCTVPVIKSWRELGIDIDEAPASTRASMNGQVSEKITYPDWLKQQSSETQKDILGKSRYEMFKNGVPLDKFMDMKKVKLFTLKELEEMDIK